MSRLLVAVTLACVAGTCSARSAEPQPAAVTPAAATPSWAAHVDVFGYLLPDDPFASAVGRADRGALHLEGRFQYEDLRTFSAWVGRSVEAGTTFHVQVVPMAGALVGRTRGFAPGAEITLTWKRLGWYGESEYVFDVDGAEGDFFYAWSQVGGTIRPWLEIGLAIQRTRVYHSEYSIDRGPFVAARRGRFGVSAYGFNLGGEDPFAILALGLDL